MREIKFRGRDEYGEWHYGAFMGVFYDGVVAPIEYANIYADDMASRVFPDTVGQFTGLKDYVGKDIYEGDILRDTEGRIFQVVWNTGAGAWEFVGSKLHMLFIMTYPDLYRVIGNVYDTPGFLKEGGGDVQKNKS